MHKIYLHCVGKPKEKWIDQGVDMFISRMKPYAEVTILYYKTNQDLEKLTYPLIALTPEGASLDSVEFSNFLLKTLDQEGARAHFVIGAFDGLTETLKQKAIFKLSISKMTFTHEMAKLFLVEQIYRAFEIKFNRGYHK